MNLITKIRGKKSALVRGKKSVLVHAFGIFTTVKESLQIRLFMQNEPNFRKSQMNVTDYIRMDYVKWTLGERGKNEPKTNPIYPCVASGEAGSKPISTPHKGGKGGTF